MSGDRWVGKVETSEFVKNLLLTGFEPCTPKTVGARLCRRRTVPLSHRSWREPIEISDI